MDLIEWMVNNHVQFSKRMEIRDSPLGGTGVFASTDIFTDDVLLCVPKKVTLSPKTCGIANLLLDLDLDPMQALVFAYIFEKSQPNSPWKAFIHSIQQTPRPDVPRMWPQDQKDLLKHTDIAFSGGLDYEQFEMGFAEAAEFFADLGYDLTLEEYTDAILRVSSRAFDVDNFHQLALVPGACLFNHSDANNVRFETDGSVCDMCGAQACGCQHSSDDEEDEFDEEEQDEEEPDEQDDINDDDDDDQSDNESVDLENVCEIRALQTITPGQEIFNTYGDDGNSALLSRYGFVIPHNRDEVVDITRDMFQYSKRNDIKDRYHYWKKNFAKFVEEDVDEDAWRDALFIDADGELSGPATLLATVFSLSQKEYAKFVKTGSYNLKSDQPVKVILCKILESRLTNYRDGELSSSQYFAKAKTLDYPLKAVAELIGTEKEVVEKALADVKS